VTLCAPWITRAELGSCGCVPAPDPQTVDEAIAAASEILYRLSGEQYSGLCDVQLRPCGSPCRCDYDTCSCNRLPRVFLGYDVAAVASVDVAGTLLDPEDYLLANGWLIRTDGAAWPCCQNIGAAPGEPDTFTVTGTAGAEPTVLAVRAVTALATELVRACTPGTSCSLPDRVTSIVRQGVAITLLDPFEFLSAGRTGLYLVDLFLAAANPAGARRRSRAWSPDLPVTRRQAVGSS